MQTLKVQSLLDAIWLLDNFHIIFANVKKGLSNGAVKKCINESFACDFDDTENGFDKNEDQKITRSEKHISDWSWIRSASFHLMHNND